ncbi:hypothetical protein LOTGIDRAFT_141696 [Lottia gigantea]|uniref:Protein FAM72A n=1 Tax=Lottia gigantea TaxID=225164 RepID=V4B0N0_LOTGI|nr:hypothetical protein LOTGIDRAFT_141696 [Lottia gigantea]ESO99726.1 hypothetical protein LOTGIDRAFT_141696 [Lottia gigantea]
MNIPSNKDEQNETIKKTKVYNLDCISCDSNLCWRGIPAPVFTEKRTRLFSTDSPLMESVDLVPGSETMDRCSCRLQSIACLHCGNVVGYHVKRPCRKCLVKCKNKHLWVFYPDSVTAMERFDFKSKFEATWFFKTY